MSKPWIHLEKSDLMSRNLFFSTWFTCSIHINKKIYIKIELHNVIYSWIAQTWKTWKTRAMPFNTFLSTTESERRYSFVEKVCDFDTFEHFSPRKFRQNLALGKWEIVTSCKVNVAQKFVDFFFPLLFWIVIYARSDWLNNTLNIMCY